jgi:hypothetical protein
MKCDAQKKIFFKKKEKLITAINTEANIMTPFLDAIKNLCA